MADSSWNEYTRSMGIQELPKSTMDPVGVPAEPPPTWTAWDQLFELTPFSHTKQ